MSFWLRGRRGRTTVGGRGAVTWAPPAISRGCRYGQPPPARRVVDLSIYLSGDSHSWPSAATQLQINTSPRNPSRTPILGRRLSGGASPPVPARSLARFSWGGGVLKRAAAACHAARVGGATGGLRKAVDRARGSVRSDTRGRRENQARQNGRRVRVPSATAFGIIHNRTDLEWTAALFSIARRGLGISKAYRRPTTERCDVHDVPERVPVATAAGELP